jgi:hypothetical protein
VRRESSGHTESVDESLNTLGRHGEIGVESGDTSLEEEGGKEGRSSMSRLIVSNVSEPKKAMKRLTPVRKTNLGQSASDSCLEISWLVWA